MNMDLDLKDKLSVANWLSGKKHVANWWIVLLAVFGVGLIGAAAWTAVNDWRVDRQNRAATAEGEAAVGQLLEPVRSIKRVLADGQVQALAVRRFGETLIRIGLWPKRLLLCRTDTPFAKMRSGQVEILGGGYQEPMLAILPDRDAMLREALKVMTDAYSRSSNSHGDSKTKFWELTT